MAKRVSMRRTDDRPASVKLRVAAALFALSAAAGTGCHEPREGANAGRASPSLAPSLPPSVAPAPPVAQVAPTLDDLDDTLAKATATCFVGEAFERRCPAWLGLRDNLRARPPEDDWHGRIRALLDADDRPARLAMELLNEGSLSLPEATHAAARAQLWRVVEADSRPAELRALAVRALGKVLDGAAVDRLLARLADPSAEVRAAVAYLLGAPQPILVEARPRVVAALLKVLRSEAQGDEVRGAIRSLGALREEAAAEALVARLDDPLVGANAVMALAGLRDPRAFTALLQRLEAGGVAGEVAPGVIAAVGTLAAHPQFDAKRVETALSGIENALKNKGMSRSDAPLLLELTRQARAALAAAAAAAPSPATPASGPRPKAAPR